MSGVPEAKPCRSAFWDDAALPASVRGPVDFDLVDGAGCGAMISPASVQQLAGGLALGMMAK